MNARLIENESEGTVWVHLDKMDWESVRVYPSTNGGWTLHFSCGAKMLCIFIDDVQFATLRTAMAMSDMNNRAIRDKGVKGDVDVKLYRDQRLVKNGQ